jgi:hypothetical protein
MNMVSIKMGTKFVTKLNRQLVLEDGQIASLKTVYCTRGKNNGRPGSKYRTENCVQCPGKDSRANYSGLQLGLRSEFYLIIAFKEARRGFEYQHYS